MTRRDFIAVAWQVPIGVWIAGTCALEAQQAAPPAAGFDRFLVPVPSCRDLPLTPAVTDDGMFRPGAPLRTAIFGALAPDAPRLTVSGRVGGHTCGWIAGAIVECWQADARGMYDRGGFRGRGRQQTGDQGEYHIDTVMPGAMRGRTPHIDVRVTVPRRAKFQTAMFFPDDARNARDRRFRPELLVTRVATTPHLIATFDIVLDL